MHFKILADVVVFLHLLWILFLFFGSLPGRRNKAIRILHISGLAFALVIQIFGWYCPLTYLEAFLRERQSPGTAYPGSFIIRYVEKIVYIEVSNTAIFVGTILLAVFNAWIYLRKR